MSESARNVEHEVLQWSTNMLHIAFRNSIKSLTGKFYAAQLLTDEVKRKCLDGNDKVEFLVSNLQDRVSLDNAAYDTIKQVLEKENGVSYIVEKLENKRSEIKQEVQELEEKRIAEAKKLSMEKVEAERLSMELKYGHGNQHFQETVPHKGEEGVPDSTRPSWLPTYPKALPTMHSYSPATSRNVAVSSFPHNASNPALFRDSEYPMLPFNKSHTPSQSLSGDSFPQPASSPGTSQFRTYYNTGHSQPSAALAGGPSGSGSGGGCSLELAEQFDKMQIVTGTYGQTQQQTASSPTTGHTEPSECIVETTMAAKTSAVGGASTTGNSGGHDNEEIYLSFPDETSTDLETKANVDTNEKSSRPVGHDLDRLALPQRTRSQSSDDSNYSTPNSSMSLTNSMESVESHDGSKSIKSKCGTCAVLRLDISNLEMKLEELTKKYNLQEETLERQQHSSRQQVDNFRAELNQKEQGLTVMQHRHRQMEAQIVHLQAEIHRLYQFAEPAVVVELKEILAVQQEEMKLLKQERDRERSEKEKERLQKEKECLEKEKVRHCYEQEREKRLTLQNQVAAFHRELSRAKSLQCEEANFYLEAAEQHQWDDCGQGCFYSTQYHQQGNFPPAAPSSLHPPPPPHQHMQAGHSNDQYRTSTKAHPNSTTWWQNFPPPGSNAGYNTSVSGAAPPTGAQGYPPQHPHQQGFDSTMPT